MGLHHLWEILDPVQKNRVWNVCKGKHCVLTLTTWICEEESTLQLKHAISKPYLRNLFFRVTCLQSLGAYLIFVSDGKPPVLKWDTILNRQQNTQDRGGRYRGQGHGWQSKSKTASQSAPLNRKKTFGMSLFQRKIRECAEMLWLFGIPCLQSNSEAEAFCALLNKEGIAMVV